MTEKEKLSEFLQNNDGIITTADAQRLGVSKTYFMEYVREKSLKRASHGVYLSEDAWQDAFRQLQLRFPKMIYSHESALYLHGQSEREPNPISITVKTGYHAAGMKDLGLQVYSVREELFELGLVGLESPTGYQVRSYDLERTLCDMLRSQSRTDRQELLQAFKNYTRSKNRNIPKLMRYAEKFRIAGRMETYLEVLL